MDTKGKLITMQDNLGHGRWGAIILTTQERVDNNRPMIARDIVDSDHAQRLVLCWNEHDKLKAKADNHNELLAACKDFVEHPECGTCQLKVRQAIANAEPQS